MRSLPESQAREGRIRAAIFLMLAGLVLVAGQKGRELLAPDDLREAEVAREMWERGDYVVPHLAGLPFVEKPPGFPAVVAAAYRVGGGPSAFAGRVVSLAFALASVGAVFLLGYRILGLQGGALAAALLAFSFRFCRTAHEILLDNALAAASACVLMFIWMALESGEARRKRYLFAGAAGATGLAFLFKGFVGPALIGAGFLAYVIASGRKAELRYALAPLPVAAFLGPVSVWVLPFVLRTTPGLVRQFFVNEQIGRFARGYHSHVAPFYFYLVDIWGAFAPASLLLPFALAAALRCCRKRSDARALYFLMMSLAPLVLLSISRAKASVYFLPVYPALSMLVAWWCAPVLSAGEKRTRIGMALAATFSILVAAAAVAGSGWFGEMPFPVAAAALATACGAWATLFALRRRDLWGAALGMAALCAIGWLLFFTGPIAALEVNKRNMRPYIEELLKAAGDREILLYNPTDRIRGSMGFYRNRTAPEIRSPEELLGRLTQDHRLVALLQLSSDEGIPTELKETARASGIRLIEEARISLPKKNDLLLIRASQEPSSPR